MVSVFVPTDSQLKKTATDNPAALPDQAVWIDLFNPTSAEDKMVDPHFTMLWRDQMPTVRARDDAGKATTIVVSAGRLGEATAPPPPAKSPKGQDPRPIG